MSHHHHHRPRGSLSIALGFGRGTFRIFLNVVSQYMARLYSRFVNAVTTTPAPDSFMTFDGSNEYLQADTASHLDWSGSTQSLTLMAWIRTTDTTGGNQALVGRWVGENRCLWWDVPRNGGSSVGFRIYISDDGSGAKKNYTANVAINDGNWHLIAITFQGNGTGVDGTLKTYIDNAEVTPTKDTDSTCDRIHYNSADPLLIGSLTTSAYRYNGDLYGFTACVGKAFSLSEIQEAYNSGTAIHMSEHSCWSDIQANGCYLTFSELADDATGSTGTITDASGNGVSFTPLNTESGDIQTGGPT